MSTFSIRTRLNDRRCNTINNSLEIQDVSKFIRSSYLHQTPTGKSYLRDIINHFTDRQYEKCADILAQNAIFKIVQKRGSVYRPGDASLFYNLIIFGRLAELREGQCIYYETGEGVGDEELLFCIPYRQSYVFECAGDLAILCQINKLHYEHIFPEKLSNISEYLHIVNRCEIFTGIDHVRKVLLLKDSQEISLKKGQKLYDQGTQIKGIYIVLEGTVVEQVKYTRGEIGDVMPYELMREADFDRYIESYDAKRYNEQKQVQAKVFYKEMDVVGLLEIFEDGSTRFHQTICTHNAKLLFIPLGNVRRFGQLQQAIKKNIFKHRRKSQFKISRHRTLESRSVTKSRNSPDRYQFRKLRYDRQLFL